MIEISTNLQLPDGQVELIAIRSQGAGGQHVNKVSTAIHLRFDISQSTLPVHIKSRLLHLKDRRINRLGVIIIKAQQHRSQEKNKQDAIARLVSLIQSALSPNKHRIPTKPKKNAIRKGLDHKVKKGKQKQLRSKVRDY